MSHKTFLAAALVAGTAVLAGCDPTGAGFGPTLPVATPAATATPVAFAGFPSNATVTGRVLFDGGAPGESLNIQYKTGGSRSSVTADSDKNGYFSFSNIPDAQAVQLIWDDSNAFVVTDADFNVAGLFVSAPVVAKTNPDKMNPMVTMDIKWKPAPTPALNAKTNGTFSFTRIPNLEATYEIAIFDASKSAKASKVVADGAASADLTTVFEYSSLAAGNYLYQIKFYAKTGTFGGSNLYGSTKYMPFQK
jgi:hypothetical protein